jgi:hypothetical protein
MEKMCHITYRSSWRGLMKRTMSSAYRAARCGKERIPRGCSNCQ